MVAVDGFAVFAQTVVLVATLLALLLSVGYLKREHLEGPEYFALMLCSATGMMLMTTANDLITIFLSLEILSIALYVLAAFDRRRTHVAGGRPQVLRARLVLVGGVPLRRRARLRRDRHDEPHRHRDVPRDDHAARTTACCSLGIALPARRPRLQGRGGAVPHVDARRVPGRADAGHRVHGRRPPRRPRSRRSCACSSARSRSTSVDWRPIDVGARGAVAARRQHRRGRPDRREAHARVLVDRARGLHPDRRAGRDRARARARRSSTCSRTRS